MPWHRRREIAEKAKASPRSAAINAPISPAPTTTTNAGARNPSTHHVSKTAFSLGPFAALRERRHIDAASSPTTQTRTPISAPLTHGWSGSASVAAAATTINATAGAMNADTATNAPGHPRNRQPR